MANEKIVVGYGAYMLKLAVATSNYGNARLKVNFGAWRCQILHNLKVAGMAFFYN